jgi:hypothetical protein
LQGGTTGATLVEQPDHLSALHQESCPAVIWNRQPARNFQDWIDALDPTLLPQGRIVVQPDAVRKIMAELCEIAQTPTCAQCDQLIDDVAGLADIFATLMKAPYLRLRLQVVTSNACRKFHIDAITARLVCTYRGTGTQYGISEDGNDPKHIVTTATGAPIMLRGTRWPETPSAGLLHRSPPIEGTSETRLVLVLDPIFNLEDTE